MPIYWQAESISGADFSTNQLPGDSYNIFEANIWGVLEHA